MRKRAKEPSLPRELESRSPDAIRARLVRQGASPSEAEAGAHDAIRDLVWQTRGIDMDSWRCTCGAPYTSRSYPHEECRASSEDKVVCGRPFPIRCIQEGCGAVVEPRVLATEGDLRSNTSFIGLPADRLCDRCAKDERHRARASAWATSSVPKEERSIGQRGYWYSSERVRAIEKVEVFVTGIREQRGHSLYLWGAPGRGKTAAAACALHTVAVIDGTTSSFFWTSHAQLRAWHEQLFQRDTERARALSDDAVRGWHLARHTQLLVIDELVMTEVRGKFAERLGELIRERLTARAPMIFTSNVEPQWTQLDPVGRIDSRWQELGLTVEVTGPDWRQRR